MTGDWGEARRPSRDPVLAIAGVLTSGMALYHFWLPHAFRWGDALTGTPALRWGIFMINASFSYLLLAGGLITLAIALSPGTPRASRRVVILAVGGYWLFNTIYQLFDPLPLPSRVASLRWAFTGFSVAVTLLYAAGWGARAGDGGPATVLSPTGGAGGRA